MTVDYKNYKSVFQYPQSTFGVGFVYLKRTHTYLLKSWRFTFDLSCYMYLLANLGIAFKNKQAMEEIFNGFIIFNFIVYLTYM